MFGNLPTLVVGGLGVEAVVEQIECLGVCSFVRQREGIEVDGVYEVDGQIATATLAFADEVVFVGGGDERGTALSAFTETGVGIAHVRLAGSDDVLEGFVLLVRTEGYLVKQYERCL